MTRNIPVRKFRENLAGVLDNVTKHLDRYVILNRGKPAAILMCVDDYEGWLETLDIMCDKAAMKDIRLARKELKEGKFHTFEDVFAGRRNRIKKIRA